MGTKKERVYIRVTETQKERLQKMAQKENRSLSNYILTVVENYINKEEIGMRNDFTGAKWGDLNEREQSYLLSEASPIDGRTGNKPKKSMECIIDLANGYSVPGYCKISADEDEIIIEDDAVIYNPTS